MKAVKVYQSHGLGIRRDIELNNYGYLTSDILDLASYMYENRLYRTGPITLLAEMFLIGYRTGIRAERAKTYGKVKAIGK